MQRQGQIWWTKYQETALHPQGEMSEAAGEDLSFILQKSFFGNVPFQVVCLVCRGNSNHSCDPCGKMFQRAWQLKEHMQEEHGEGGGELEEEKRVTRTSARFRRNQEIVEKQPSDDEIMILDINKEFSEEEESKYVLACKKKMCEVRIIRITNFSPTEESESGNLILRSNSTDDFVNELIDQILKNVVDENIDQYVKDMLGHIINNVVLD